MTGTPRTAGRLIADALAAAGVRVAYTVPGESFLPLLDGLVGAGIRVVATRHEGGAAFMAAASAALSGHPTAVLATRAVGAANLAIGLHVAHADSLPVIALVGQVERSVRGREATIGGYCRWAREVRDVATLPGIMDEALRRATSGRPGPVLLSLPEDLLAEEVPEAPARTTNAAAVGPSRMPPPDPVHVRRVLHLLLDAERPVILAGGGVLRSRATADLVRLAEFVDVPVVAAWRRPDVFPDSLGQVTVVPRFVAKTIDLTGIVLTKLDGDARGGAALSVVTVTGKPILFASVGEKLTDLETFHPDRMASRILDMGDVLTLIEQAEKAFDAEQAEELAGRIAARNLGIRVLLAEPDGEGDILGVGLVVREGDRVVGELVVGWVVARSSAS